MKNRSRLCGQKTLHTYLIQNVDEWELNGDQIDKLLEAHKSEKIGAMQESRFGWVPTFKNASVYCENISGKWIIRAEIQSKVMPASSINDELNQRLDAIEEAEGRRPGRKERNQLKEDIRAQMLPKAFVTTKFISAWIDLHRGLLVVSAGSESDSDDFTAHLREALGTLSIVPLHGFLHEDLTQWYEYVDYRPDSVSITTNMKLNLAQDTTVKASFKNIDEDSEQIRQLIGNGMRIVEMECDFDDQMFFVIDQKLTLKRLKFSETLIDQASNNDDPRADAILMLETMDRWFDAIGANKSLLEAEDGAE